ncbi:MAG: sialidase family protein [Alphaproteobacteria bacterium]
MTAILSVADVLAVAPTALCHAPSLTRTPDGLLAAWFGGTTEGASDTAIWTARHVAGRWLAPQIVMSMAREPCWNPVLMRLAADDLRLYFQVGDSPLAWRCMVAASADHGVTWTAARPLSGDASGPVRCRPLRLENGDLLSPSSREQHGWQCHVERSGDGGRTWRRIDVPGWPEVAAIQPCLLDHGGGVIQVLCRTRQGRVAVSWSQDGGANWSRLRLSALANPDAALDALRLTDGRLLLASNPQAGDRTPLTAAVSHDGIAWHTVLTLADGPRDHAYPSLAETDDGRVHVVWSIDKARLSHAVIDPARF